MEQKRKPAYKYCLVPMCKNTSKSTPDKVFFLVPRNSAIREKWCKAMRRDNVSPSSCLYCCEDHFEAKEDTENYMEYKIMSLQGRKVTLHLKKNVIPHKFHFQKDNRPPLVRDDASKRQRLELVEEAMSEYAVKLSSGSNFCKVEPSPSSSNISLHSEAGPSTCSSNPHYDKSLIDKAIQVGSRVQYRSKGVTVKDAKKDIALSPFLVPSKNASTSPMKCTGVKRKLFCDKSLDYVSTSSPSQPSESSTDYEVDSSSSEVSWVSGKDSDKEKHFKNSMRSNMLIAIERDPKIFLGLPKDCYYLIKILSENIPLPTIDILITLKKIKLNDSFSILAVHFGYTQSTVSRIFSKSISLIEEKMKELIIWPTPQEILKQLPISFRARYANVVSIIDCLEIQIEKPSNAIHQSLTWSQYKNCNTLKYLISCTPDGLVNFISNGYGGRATDVMIVQDCGYLECLPPKTAVMADRGFKDLSHKLGMKKCTLVRPPSVSKSTPSTKEEVKQSKRIAALRIHVERVISRLREFHMLLPHACIDHNLIPVIDKVMVIACGIINLQDALIKK